MADPHTESVDVYEMLWDCKFCRTQKLLGLTHRHCPVCGAPQDAARRYFPSDAEKVRVADHEYVGRDLMCGHCGTYNSRRSRHCRDCGAPTAEGVEASLLADVPSPSEAVAPAPQMLAGTQPSPPKRARSRWSLLVGCLLLTLLAAALALFSWKKEATFSVTGHTWERRIDIERFGPVRDSAWCDQLPSGAREIRRYRAVRSHEQVPDGETCTTRKVDQGDGTFREVKDCKPRYKTRDIEGDRCDYEVNRWVTHRFVETKGQTTTPPPTWPPMPAFTSCRHVGCERAGARRETYRVLLTGQDGEESCDLAESRWLTMTPGQRYRAKVRVIGGVDCSSLTVQ